MDSEFNEVALTLAPSASETAVLQTLDRLLQPYDGLGRTDLQIGFRAGF
jgi:hypothetical protein